MIRRAYALPLRRRIVNDANEIGIKRAAAKWRVSRSNLYRWTQEGQVRKAARRGTALRDTIDAVVKEVAEKYGVSEASITSSETNLSKPLRAEAWRQIISLSGCTHEALAGVWGCHPNTIGYGLKRYEAGAEHMLRMLEWSYGPRRALQMVIGRDQSANADLAAWNALGDRRAAA